MTAQGVVEGDPYRPSVCAVCCPCSRVSHPSCILRVFYWGIWAVVGVGRLCGGAPATTGGVEQSRVAEQRIPVSVTWYNQSLLRRWHSQSSPVQGVSRDKRGGWFCPVNTKKPQGKGTCPPPPQVSLVDTAPLVPRGPFPNTLALELGHGSQRGMQLHAGGGRWCRGGVLTGP